jgi:hypothetical protein
MPVRENYIFYTCLTLVLAIAIIDLVTNVISGR